MKNAAIFETIEDRRHGTTSEEVARRLRDMIHRGILRPGERLPPERDLAKLLGVSRPTLRTGIQALTAVGVLYSKQGAGNFVSEAGKSPTLDPHPLKLLASLSGFTADEMFETRMAIEMVIAGLAAERATGEELAAMSEAIADMFASLELPAEYLVHDMRFHQIVAAASGNRILTALMNMLGKILIETRRQTVHRALDLKEATEFHRLIYRCIRDHDPEAASRAMRAHLEHTKEAQKREELKNVGEMRNFPRKKQLGKRK